ADSVELVFQFNHALLLRHQHADFFQGSPASGACRADGQEIGCIPEEISGPGKLVHKIGDRFSALYCPSDGSSSEQGTGTRGLSIKVDDQDLLLAVRGEELSDSNGKSRFPNSAFVVVDRNDMHRDYP